MQTHSLILATALSLLFTSPVHSQESLAERQADIQPFRYPEIQRATELPAAGEARRFDLELTETERPHKAPPRYGENHWKEGMVAGGVVTLLLLFSVLSDNPGALPAGETAGATLVVGALFGTIGALIGGMIPK